MFLPLTRNTEIIVQSVGDELLVYDLKTNKAYNLNKTSAIVYNACNGETTVDDLKLKHRFTDDIIHFALDELKRENLIEGEYKSVFTNVSRRDVIKKVGLASMIALPIITSLVAPKSADAQSLVGRVCSVDSLILEHSSVSTDVVAEMQVVFVVPLVLSHVVQD